MIGYLETEDENGKDEKVICVPADKIDKRYQKDRNYTDLDKYTLDKIKYFFSHYKDMEENKWVKVGEFHDRNDSIKLYEKYVLD